MDRILYASNLTSFRLKDFLEDNSRTSLNNIGCQDILYYIENNDDVKSFILQFELRNVSISDVLFCVPSNLLNKVCGKFTYKYVSEVIDYFAKDKSLSKKKFWKTSKYIGDTIDCKYMKVLKTKKEKTEFVRAVGLYNFKLTQVFNHIDCNELFTLEYFKNACKQSGSTDFKEYQKNEMWRVHKFFSTKNEVRAIINLYEKHPEYVKKMIHESLCGFRKDTVKEYADKIQDERTKNEFLFTFMPTQAVPAKWREFLDTREDGYEFNFYETCGLIYACIEHPDEFKENVKGRNFVFDEHATVSFDDVFEK